ncbi:fatty acid--CoA ligase FadD11 [Kutzneria viridogrisea]|uniref:AMP-dependent synthetase/ligase domain-containing protein n=2 Tax=Kutzneria TaxID=43356 RepID=W5WFX3_9PSEU|nr:long-chain fatty acid--CoA ligase [Kutzneria albida]AHI00104.1 hypothetical protein KALB_6745 [Kutzneria albida DSM 43870]MBA8925283.1 long-subunit acyl-CoA synthetase (AMP-forming) [Kutzneria viridogrisea]
MSAPAETLCGAFQATAARHPRLVALRTPADAVAITWREYAARVRRIATGLAKLGVARGHTVALMMGNRPEFHLVDTAAFHLGATPFSLYNASTPEQVQDLVGQAGSRVVVCEQRFLPQVTAGRAGTAVEHVVCVDGEAEGTTSLAKLETSRLRGFDFEQTWRAVEPRDALTLIYTAGTTGAPKGVELSHRAMLAAVAGSNAVLDVGPRDRILSFLPAAHVADRWGTHYSQIVTGMQVTCLADRRALLPALVETRPTVLGSVPQVWDRLRASVDALIQGEADPVRRSALREAVELGVQVARHGRQDEELWSRYRALDEWVLAPLRAMIGFDRVRVALCGAAPISVETVEFVNALGVPLIEGWGMSEVSGLATMNPLDANRIGTVGRALPGVELRLAADGELLVRGEVLLSGYRDDPARTAEVVDPEGWLHTGDIASIDEDGYVRIVDRKAELIVNAEGHSISPTAVESAVRAECPLIGQLAVIGDRRPYNVALVVLDPDAVKSFARDNGLPEEPETWAADPAVLAAVEAGIMAGNERLSTVERVERFTVLATGWRPGGTELTHTLRLRRAPIAEKYAAEIEQLYSP